jgi:hypothetical protein
MTECLQIGYPLTLVQNTIYALPAKRCLLFCDTAGAALELSNTVAFSADVNLTLTDGQHEVAGGFIRSTAAAALVVLRGF